MHNKKLKAVLAGVGLAAAAACMTSNQSEACCGPPSPRSQGSPAAELPADAAQAGNTDRAGQVRVAGARANNQGSQDVTDRRYAYIEMEDYSFAPTVLAGSPGQMLRLQVENESQSPHTFTMGDGQADVVIQPGHVADLRVKFPRTGNLSFYSRSDERRGMAGALHVSGPVAKPGPKAAFQW